MIAIQPLIIMCFYTRRVLQNMSQKAIKAQDESSKLAAEAVTNLRTVTAFSSQERILQMLEKAQEGLRRESIRQSWFAGVGLALSQSLSTASWALDFWYGGKLIAKVTSQLKLSLSPIWFWPVQAVLLLLLEVWLQTLQRVLILLDQSLLFWTVTQELSLKTQRVPTWKSNRPCWNSWCEFCIGVNVLLVLIFWPDFYFSPYILFLLFLVSKPINAWYLIPYRHPTNRKCWCGWRYSKIIIWKSILTLKNCHVYI